MALGGLPRRPISAFCFQCFSFSPFRPASCPSLSRAPNRVSTQRPGKMPHCGRLTSASPTLFAQQVCHGGAPVSRPVGPTSRPGDLIGHSRQDLLCTRNNRPGREAFHPPNRYLRWLRRGCTAAVLGRCKLEQLRAPIPGRGPACDNAGPVYLPYFSLQRVRSRHA